MSPARPQGPAHGAVTAVPARVGRARVRKLLRGRGLVVAGRRERRARSAGPRVSESTQERPVQVSAAGVGTVTAGAGAECTGPGAFRDAHGLRQSAAGRRLFAKLAVALIIAQRAHFASPWCHARPLISSRTRAHKPGTGWATLERSHTRFTRIAVCAWRAIRRRAEAATLDRGRGPAGCPGPTTRSQPALPIADLSIRVGHDTQGKCRPRSRHRRARHPGQNCSAVCCRAVTAVRFCQSAG